VSRATAPVRPGRAGFDAEHIRQDFPLLGARTDGAPVVYLDNAATSQKPRPVIDAITRYYRAENANIHRGVYRLSERATAAYEAARVRVQRFLNAGEAREVIFVRGATEAINLVAYTYGRTAVGPGDEILISALEHHSNIVPWQMLCEAQGARLRVIPVNDAGELELDRLDALLGPRTRLLAVAHVSNALGTVTPVREIVARAHAANVPVLIDGAQAAPHLRVDVRDLDCDFYALSGHKVFGPTGVGVLYGKAARLELMPPFHGGGDMITSVSFERTEYAPLPAKFEAGTPHIAGAVGLGAAMEYLQQLDWNAIEAHEAALLEYATAALSSIPGVRLVGTARHKVGVVSFIVDGVHAHDVGTVADHHGVAIRAGHHCAQPLMTRFGIPATARASLAFYNTRDDIDALVAAVTDAARLFGR
jgi:cysteine desulfurase/selenocysteine lyase